MSTADHEKDAPRVVAPSLHLLSLLYGGMVTLAGVLGAKQVALGPLAVEAGIFSFLMLVALGSAIAELHGREVADRTVRFGFVPLCVAIVLTWLVIQLPTDRNMYEPAKAAFPIILGQGWRLMAAGIVAYGVSQTLNILVFSRLQASIHAVGVRAAIAGAMSQIIDTLIFISVAFYRVRPIGELLLGQMLAKVVLSIVLVPPLIYLFVGLGRKLDARPA